MVDVRVRQNHRIDRLRIEREGEVALVGQLTRALKESAVEQNAPAVDLQEVHGACNGTRSAPNS